MVGIPLTSVHQALAEAVNESEEQDERVTTRVGGELKARASAICAEHGTDLSAFIRACMRGLVRDYSHTTTSDA